MLYQISRPRDRSAYTCYIRLPDPKPMVPIQAISESRPINRGAHTCYLRPRYCGAYKCYITSPDPQTVVPIHVTSDRQTPVPIYAI
ncbi:hypothetical protein DPMN_142499 [Dreissena polymorpha]|uniref:Uncharacterized protein n=1 Tax=Dreissena polymorpha TaxID=45954 RepID=A0A9D4GHD1_DREPO|nr:hypothetical protein DPMN_142499 [Dreissena polymorpha]